MADGDLNEEELVGNLSEHDSASESSVPAIKFCPDIGSTSKDSTDSEYENLLNQVMNSEPPTPADSGGQEDKHSDDEDLCELIKQ